MVKKQFDRMDYPLVYLDYITKLIFLLLHLYFIRIQIKSSKYVEKAICMKLPQKVWNPYIMKGYHISFNYRWSFLTISHIVFRERYRYFSHRFSVKGIRSLNNTEKICADVNHDGIVNVSDVIIIAAHVKGISALNWQAFQLSFLYDILCRLRNIRYHFRRL